MGLPNLDNRCGDAKVGTRSHFLHITLSSGMHSCGFSLAVILGSQMLLPWQLQTGRQATSAVQVYPLLSLQNPRSKARSVPAQTFSSNFVHSSEKFLFRWTLPSSTKIVPATDHCSPDHCIYPREFSGKPLSSC